MVAGQRTSFPASGMDRVIGRARFTGPRTVEVVDDAGTHRTLTGTNVVLNTGMVPSVPDIPGLRDTRPLTSTTISSLAELPESILILGGGYIGCEFASMLSIMGVAVTVLQRGQALLPSEDADISAAVTAALESDGVSVRLGATAQSVARSNGKVAVTLSDGNTVEAAEILVAVGREPVTAGLGLEAAGVELHGRRLVKVDEYLHTTADGVCGLRAMRPGHHSSHMRQGTTTGS